jgi:hypothetical protein
MVHKYWLVQNPIPKCNTQIWYIKCKKHVSEYQFDCRLKCMYFSSQKKSFCGPICGYCKIWQMLWCYSFGTHVWVHCFVAKIPFCHDIMPCQINCLTILVDLFFNGWKKDIDGWNIACIFKCTLTLIIITYTLPTYYLLTYLFILLTTYVHVTYLLLWLIYL